MSLLSSRRLVRGLVAAAAVAAVAFSAMAAPSTPGASAAADATTQAGPDLRDEMVAGAEPAETFAADDVVTVIVDLTKATTMDVPGLITDYGTDGDIGDEAKAAAYREQLAVGQLNVKKAIAGLYPDAVFKYSYTNLINGFAAKIPFGLIDQVKALPGVDDVYLAQTYSHDQLRSVDTVDGTDAVNTDSGSDNQMGFKAAWAEGFTGAGKVVAIFDSGIRYTHEAFAYMDPAITAAHPDNYKTKAEIQAIINANPDMNLFKSDWGSWFHGFPQTGFTPDIQAQAKAGAWWFNEKVPFQANYVNGVFEARSANWASAGSGHGTHVAGSVAGHQAPGTLTASQGGAAADAQIMFFKIFSDFDPIGQESDEAVFAAQDDAVTLGVNAFNLSLGIAHGFSTSNVYATAGYQKAYTRAREHGISIQLAAGNDARDSMPGVISGTANTTWRPNSYMAGHSDAMFGPMSVAAANSSNAGHGAATYRGIATTTLQFTRVSDGAQAIANIAAPASQDFNVLGQVTDYASPANVARLETTPPGLQSVLPGSYPLVNVGTVTEASILAAGGKTSLTNALAGKVALVDGSILAVTQTAANAKGWGTLSAASRAAQILLEEAHPTAVLACGSGTTYFPESFNYSLKDIPTLGHITAANCTTIRNGLTNAANAAGINVNFSSVRITAAAAANSTSMVPASFTSWGVTEALRLKPEIMAPGYGTWSSTWNNDFSYGTMSGTSMASPNSEGAITLIQQILDKRIADGEITGIMRGTLEYAALVDQYAMSNAIPYVASNGTYFSPRRQGAGMINVKNVLNSHVSLRSLTDYNPGTGEYARSAVNLGDKLGDTFTITFALDNRNTTARTFNVLAALDTDNYANNSSGRPTLSSVSTTAGETARLTGATMRLTGATVGTIGNGTNNINRYATGYAPATLTVPANTSSVVTVTVELGAAQMATYDAAYRNGMFLEGFVFLDGTPDEKVSLPFMGFRGDWNASPPFDTMTAYESRTGKPLTDIDYPLYHVSVLNTRSGTAERVLGANHYRGNAWNGFFNSTSASSLSTPRTWLDTQRTNGDLTGNKTAFSPNGDGQYDIAYASLSLLRSLKALEVIIRDSSGAIVTTLGPEYEFFQSEADDPCSTKQIAQTYGTKYLRNMAWDGKDAAGNVVPDGQYTFEVRGVLEKAFIDNLGHPSTDALVKAYLSDDSNPNVHKQSFAVKVDTVAPLVSWVATSPTQIRAVASDPSGIAAMGLYINGTLSGTTQAIGTTTVDRTFTLPTGTNLANVVVQAVDYAGNLKAQAQAPVNLKAALQVIVTMYHNIYEVNKDAFTPESYAALDDVFTSARWWLDQDMVSQSVYDLHVADFATAVLGLKPVVDFSSLDAAIAAAQMMVDNPSKYVSTHMPALSAQLLAAKLVRASATSQAVVDKAFADLMAAIWLVVEIGDTTGLAALVFVANGMDPLRFTPTSWARVTAALAVGNALLASAEPRFDDVDAAFLSLADALEALVLRTAKAGLKSAIDVADSIIATIDAYVASSVAGLPAALAAAKTVYADGDATAAEVSTAQANLLTAIAAARLKATGSPILPAAVASALVLDAKAAAAAVTGKAPASVTKVFAKAKAAKIAGKTVVGSKLKAKVAAWSPKAKLSFQWYRNGKAIAKATKATYTVKATDKGAKLTVKVTGK
ncbi:MAG: S8 family serine peptidase, partial [Micrococcales bacterium]|nr:S8 family serine peptidase [Micrococcales bacterium]